VRLGFFIIVLSLSGWAVAVGDPGAIAPDKGITLFLKIVTYDNSYDFDSSKVVTLYMPYERSNPVTYEQFRQARKFLENATTLRVAGARVRFRPFEMGSLEAVMKTVVKTDYNMMIITSLEERQVKKILGLSTGIGIHSFALDPRLVPFGVAVSIRPDQNKKSILVDLVKARKEGSRFGANLLRMCEVYDGKS
jgi:hypothetical protein